MKSLHFVTPTAGARFSKVPITFMSPESRRVFNQDRSFNNFEKKLSVNEAKLTHLWTRNWAIDFKICLRPLVISNLDLLPFREYTYQRRQALMFVDGPLKTTNSYEINQFFFNASIKIDSQRQGRVVFMRVP